MTRRVSLHGVVVLLLLAVAEAGCALRTAAPRGSFVMANHLGLPERPDEDAPPPGSAAAAERGPGGELDDATFVREYVDPIIDGIEAYLARAGTRRRIVLFIHGGLNGRHDGLRRAEQYHCVQVAGTPAERPTSSGRRGCAEVLDEYARRSKLRDAGALRREVAKLEEVRGSHFVFLNWDSDLWTSVWHDLCCIRGGQYQTADVSLTPFIAASRLGGAGFLAPLSIVYQIDTVGEGAFRDGLRSDRCLGPGELQGDVGRWWGRRVAAAVEQAANYDGGSVITYWLFAIPRWLSVPAIQGFGSSAWDVMKRRAELVLAQPHDLPRNRRGAGRLLLERLVEARSGWPADVEVVLFGHSMGAIVSNRILRDFPQLRFDRIVYAGAAAGIDDVRASVHPYLLQPANRDTTFWSFSLSEPNEAREINGIDVYERGSLLVWVDNLFERPNTVSKRTFGRASNLKRFYAPPGDPALRSRINLLEFRGTPPANGRLLEHPWKHGDFDEPGVVDKLLARTRGSGC